MPLIKVFRPPNKLVCPLCPRPLDRIAKGVAFYFACPDHGVFAPLSFFESFKTTKPLVREIMAARRIPSAARAKPIACSFCGNRMRTTLFRNSLSLDQCFTCNGIWFDLGEMNALSQASELETDFPPAPSMPHVNHSGQGTIHWPSADAGVAVLRPENWVGLPGEDDQYSRRNFPYATFSFIIACVAITLRTIKDPVFVGQNIFLPEDPFRRHGFTLLTSTFMHAGFGHLAGNMGFLYICGDNVEDVVGPMNFVFILIAGAIFGDFLYAYCGGTLPALGASGGIFSIVVYYAFAFPKNRFTFPLPSRWHYSAANDARVPYMMASVGAPVVIGAWVAYNALYAYLQSRGISQGHTNYLAHAGGIAFGVFAYIFLGLKPKPTMERQLRVNK